MSRTDDILDKTKRKEPEAKKWKVVVGIVVGLVFVFTVFSPFMYVGYISGETANYDSIITYQRSAPEDILIGMAYNQQTTYLKLENINYYHPSIAVLGTSRVLQFKESYFSDSFYNAGLGVNNIDEYQNFINNIELDSYPDVLIISLDSWFFNDEWNGELSSDYQRIVKQDIHPYQIRDLLYGYLSNKWDFSDIIFMNDNLVGLLAVTRNEGIMKDGSYYYGYIYSDPSTGADYQFRDTFDRIDNGNNRFEYAQEVDSRAIEELDCLLSLCNEQNIYVIGVIPPYAPSVIDKMNSLGDNYSYLYKIYPESKSLFDKYGYELYDYTDVRSLGCDDTYFIDGFHGSDVTYLLMLMDMVNSGSKVGEYTNISILSELFENRHSNLTIHSIEEEIGDK